MCQSISTSTFKNSLPTPINAICLNEVQNNRVQKLIRSYSLKSWQQGMQSIVQPTYHKSDLLNLLLSPRFTDILGDNYEQIRNLQNLLGAFLFLGDGFMASLNDG